MQVVPSGQTCGALVSGLDLREPLAPARLEALRQAWLEHQVIGIVGQSLSVADLERFAPQIGPWGDDPFIAALPGHPHVVEVRREPDEQAPLFADNWHSDWSFLASPPAATMLYGSVVPPVGGDTLFANLHAAWEALPAAMQARLAPLQAIHSASRSYSKKGRYGEADKGRSMTIKSSDEALATQTHPLVRTHPETGRKALFVSAAYTVGIEGMPDDEAASLLAELCAHAGQERFVYRHAWQPGMLTLWDNRCLNHRATGGYEGHRRLLHRITIGERSVAPAL